jgi:transposase
VAQKAYDRPINAAMFEEWVEKCLVPTLSQGDVAVMDNLPAHKGARIEELIKAAGAELRYLPPDSPDMNPIEKAYSKLKAFLRKVAEAKLVGFLSFRQQRLGPRSRFRSRAARKSPSHLFDIR